VAVDDSDFQQHNKLANEVRLKLDFDDLQNELGGRETGRTKRFLSEDYASNHIGSKKQRDREFLTTLQLLLMNDPVYAALYRETNALLSRAETITEKLLAQAEQELLQAQTELEGVLDSANQLPDGRKVFRDAQGNVRTSDGQIVDPVDAESIVWKKGAPTYETYVDAKKEVEGAQKTVDDIRHYQVDILGGARDRMSDENSPPSKEEMEEIQKNIIDQAPEAIKPSLLQTENDTSAEKKVSLTMEMPTL